MGIIDDIKRQFRKENNGIIQLILINLFVFLGLNILFIIFKIAEQPEIYGLVKRQIFIPPVWEVFIKKPWTIITYAFSHTGFFHFFFNMLFLWWFGKLIKDYLGSKKLIALYIWGAIAGAALYLLMYNTVPYFMKRLPDGMLGASGAVYAITVGAAVLLPNHNFFLIFIGRINIRYIALFYVIGSVLQVAGDNAGGNLAHIGGALAGFIYIKQLRAGFDLGKPFYAVGRFFKKLLGKREKIKVTYHNTDKTSYTRTASDDEYNAQKAAHQAEVDRILDKISESGYESLSKAEKQTLFNAGK